MNSEGYMDYVRGEIALRGCRVLDVGAGGGAISEYFVKEGADEVIALEPESSGSDYKAASFERLSQRADSYGGLRAIPETLQEYQPSENFDVVLLHNSINHLNESAVQSLHEDPDARAAFENLISKLSTVTTEEGKVIVLDSGRASLWRYLPKSPFSIEWEKHQDPHIWVDLFEQLDFEAMSLRWTPVFGYGPVVEWLSGYKFGGFLRTAHFRLAFVHRLSQRNNKQV